MGAPAPQAAQPVPATALPAPDPAGTAQSTLLRRYRPLETRATGGFGSVEICLDRRLQRRVAIKRIPLTANGAGIPAQTMAAALAEARTAGMLAHPNIVSVLDFTFDAAYAYLVMEYVDGMNLAEFLARVDGNSLTYDEAACVADALVQALAHAHANGVLHLDIKPANVLIDRAGHVKLADFGMATLASAAGFGGARGGTIGYMPPEQLEGLAVDERADVFSLAAVLYECLCGNAPFVAATPADSLALIESGAEAPSELLPELPADAEAALLQALSPTPAVRMAEVQELGDRFCAELGDPRAGRSSLARIIERLTSDEDPDATIEAPAETEDPWERDPAEGLLGSRFPQARRVLRGVVAGAATAFSVHAYDPIANALHAASTSADPAQSAPGWILASLVTGVAGGVAPQLAAAFAALLATASVLDPASIPATLPTAVLLAAIGLGWWIAWGRTPGAAAGYTATLALALVSGDAVALAPLAAAYLAFDAPPAAAAATFLTASVTAAAVLAQGAGAGVPLSLALGAWTAPAFLVQAVGLAATAALVSFVLQRAWRRYDEAAQADAATAPAAGFALAAALPLPLVVALTCLAHPMEIPSLPPQLLAPAIARGTVSSIIVGICLYLFGYRKEPSEGDCS